jgi:hypothetical protein
MTAIASGNSPISITALADIMQATHGDKELFHTIVNAPFLFRKETVKMSLGIIVFLQVNKQRQTIDRLTLSDNELAKGTKDMSSKPFEEIRIPVDDSKNSLAVAIRTGKPQIVTDWAYLFTPALNPEQARLNQAGGGIGCSVVYPLLGARDGGAMIFSYFKYSSGISAADHDFMRAYADLIVERLH